MIFEDYFLTQEVNDMKGKYDSKNLLIMNFSILQV